MGVGVRGLELGSETSILDSALVETQLQRTLDLYDGGTDIF